jgi:ElaB/YqjD/DUF883 family membrane-anchored ribosome-binding protein
MKNDVTADEVTTQKMIDDLKVVARDAEVLIKATASDVGEKSKEARERLMETLESAKATAMQLEARLEQQAIAAAKATDKAIREHPYQSLGIAFGVGLLIGVLTNRR